MNEAKTTKKCFGMRIMLILELFWIDFGVRMPPEPVPKRD